MIEVRNLARGIRRITLPLPFEGLHSVNCYVFGEAGDLTLVDVGVGGETTWRCLVEGLGQLGLGLSDIARVVATHLHPDHMGLATALHEEVGCDYVMHQLAAERLDFYNDWGSLRLLGEIGTLHGAPPEVLTVLTEIGPRPAWAPPSIRPTVLVEDGDTVQVGEGRHLSVVHTPGHEPAHICLLDSASGALLTGDHVLPRITPFVPYLGEGTNNLATYLNSLQRVEDIDPHITYPAHLGIIERGKARARQIALHHERRLGGMLQFLRSGPRTAWEVMETAFRPHLPPLHMRLAFQETLAHLEYLRFNGDVERSGEPFHYRRT